MFARTERLLLRPGWREDAPALARAIGEEAVARNLSRVPWPYGVADAEQFLTAPTDGVLPRLLIFERTEAEPRLVGGIGMHRDGTGDAEFGYWIAKSHWGRGIATEAGRAVIDIARRALRLPRLVAGHALDNPASGRVLSKLGFRPTGSIRPRESVARGGRMDCADFALDLDDGGRMRLAA